MTPDQHAATVEQAKEFADALQGAAEVGGTVWSQLSCEQMARTMRRLVALAERATELEADCREWREVARIRLAEAEAAEARATELERERDKWRGRWERTDDERQAQHKRAVRYETALYNHGYGARLCRCEWCAALGETAQISEEGMIQPHYRPGDLGPVDVDDPSLGETAPQGGLIDQPMTREMGVDQPDFGTPLGETVRGTPTVGPLLRKALEFYGNRDSVGETAPFRCVLGYPGPLPCRGCPPDCPEHREPAA